MTSRKPSQRGAQQTLTDEKHPLRQLAGVLAEPKHPWQSRFEWLAQNLLAHRPVLFLFDNFEDNLKDGALADELAALLARWLQAPGLSRLVLTCRYPFALPDDLHERLAAFHLGPMSWAETRKLFWRLEGLKALPTEDQRRAYESVGGHPRALEYFDAILRGGKARFPDVQSRLRKQLKDKGIADPARWCTDTGGGLDAALAETVTLAADDVLLDQLLAQLADDPLSRRLLIGAAVYRVPVTALGLTWSVGEAEHEPDWLVRQKQKNRLVHLMMPPPPADWVRPRLQEAQKKTRQWDWTILCRRPSRRYRTSSWSSGGRRRSLRRKSRLGHRRGSRPRSSG